jgi:hypothetical protein
MRRGPRCVYCGWPAKVVRRQGIAVCHCHRLLLELDPYYSRTLGGDPYGDRSAGRGAGDHRPTGRGPGAATATYAGARA